MAAIADFEPRQPKAERRRRLRNRHGYELAALANLVVTIAVGAQTGRWRRRGSETEARMASGRPSGQMMNCTQGRGSGRT